MDFDELKQILEMVREHDLAEFELERNDLKIRIRKNAAGQMVTSLPTHSVMPAQAAALAAPAPSSAPALTPADDELDLAVLKSPIVGTFYRQAEPGAPPFAEVGALVKKGQVLCIIEAMKLMNEINSDVDGEVVKVYVENGQPVQYGERLFAIKPRAL
jgi:acetyl-CoA carboxylase biotin carboxyl carrier protein